MASNDSSALRVGFVMHKMQVAGAEVLVKQIIEQLGETIEATVLCLDGVGKLGRQLQDQGVPVLAFDRKSGVDWRMAKLLANECKQRRIEVLHAHQYTPFFYSALAKLRYGAKPKILFTEHGRHYPDVVSWKRRWTNRLVLQRLADMTTACCDFSTQALRKTEGFSGAITLRNGVDLGSLPSRGEPTEQRQLRESLGLDPDRPYAACIARFHPVKDHATLIQAWRRVHSAIPHSKLLLIGDGPERARMESLAKQLGLQDSIEFWGVRADVSNILRAVDVFTLTSVSEAASLTLLEAMASGCASVVTDVGGNAEHLRAGVDGYLPPRGDADQLGERLTELLSDNQKCRDFGRLARQRIERDFCLTKVIDSYAACYQQLAGRSLARQRGNQVQDRPEIRDDVAKLTAEVAR